MSAAQKLPEEKILNVSRSEMGKADTLRYNVNYFLVQEEYPRAIEEIESYKKRDFELPKYREKVLPYLNHAIDLIHAIQSKKALFDNPSLTRSKRQELQDKVQSHYDELQAMFKKMDQIRNQLQMEDVRSTTWVIQSVVYSAFAILLVFLIKELSYDLLHNFEVVWTYLSERMVDELFKKMGW